MRRILPSAFLLLAYALVVAALVVVTVRRYDRPHPCRATFEPVREGMTLAEVVATVGGPPGYHTSGPGTREGGCGRG